MLQWYCVYTQARLELWAQSNLWERGFDVYLPKVLKRRSHARRVDFVPWPLFPHYMFVRADLEHSSLRAISSAKGVVDILRCGSGTAPTQVRESIIEEIRGREDTEGYVRLDEISSLNQGDRVRIAAGALCDQVGLFENVEDNQRVVILLDLLGRSVRTRIAAGDLERGR